MHDLESFAKNLTWQDIYRATQHLLLSILPSPEAEAEARLLCGKMSGLGSLVQVSREKATVQDMLHVAEIVKKRTEERIPLAYLIGEVEFCGMTLHIKSPILIPRPETEQMVTEYADQIKKASMPELKVLDACSGSGAIALGLLQSLPTCRLAMVGVDINPVAISLATENTPPKFTSSVSWVASDLEAYLNQLPDASFDAIISNPPYLTADEFTVAVAECPELAVEDRGALCDSGGTGISFYCVILRAAGRILSNRLQNYIDVPRIVFEVGHTQALAVSNYAQQCGFRTQIRYDLGQKQRFIWCW